MAELGFQAFDADNHYYEAEDAFTRHVDRRMRGRCMQWVELDGRKRLLVGGRINRFIPNPTFDPVARPGALDEFFRGRNPEHKSMPELFGRLEPIDPAYRDRDARLDLMDRQGIEAAWLFPTLGVGMQESLKHDPEAAGAAFTAFNRWLEEDWGFAYEGRLFGAPYVSLMDVEWATREIESLIERGVRVISLVPGPAWRGDRAISPGDPSFDPFWARVAEAGVLACFHSGDAGYRIIDELYGGTREFRAFDFQPLRVCLSAEPIHDTLAALICDGALSRHPGLRVATIECGSEWVHALLRKLAKAYGQMATSFAADPVEQLRERVWIAPYYEDDLLRLREAIGVDHMLFGSDFPHAEGLAEPTDFVTDLEGFGDDEIRRVMRDNAAALTAAAG